MTFDALSLSALRGELADRCLGGRVQRVVRPTDLSIALEIYAGQRCELLLSAEPESAGLYLPELRARRGTEKPSPLQLLLRKHVRGAHLVEVSQPPLERVLRLGFEGPLGRVDLVCEVMGRLSNLVLVAGDGSVLDAAKRVPASVNRFRTILPHRPYIGPPAQAKRSPGLLTADELSAVLAAGDGPLWRRLVDGVAAVSPLLAREVVYRATGSVTEAARPSPEVVGWLLAILKSLLAADGAGEGAWLACEVRDGLRRPVEFAPYEPRHYPDREPAESLFAAIEQVMAAKGPADAYRPARQRLQAVVGEQVARHRARLTSLRKALAPAGSLETLQMQGTAILASAWAIRPGQQVLEVDLDELGLEAGADVARQQSIALDPDLSAAENAQKLFREYRRLQAASAQVPGLIQESERELDYLRQLETEIALADDRAQLDEVEASLVAASYLRRPSRRAKPAASLPLRWHTAEGALILVGRNSRQNETVTFREAAPDDTWLHAHGVPGAHVVVRMGGRPVSEATLQAAAQLAAHYSRNRDEARVQVDYTPRRFVRPTKGGRPGMVTYSHEQTLTVEPALPERQEEWVEPSQGLPCN